MRTEFGAWKPFRQGQRLLSSLGLPEKQKQLVPPPEMRPGNGESSTSLLAQESIHISEIC